MKYTDEPLSKLFLPRKTPKNNLPVVEDGGAVAQTPVVERIREGLPLSEFNILQKLLDIPEEHLAKSIGISNATLHRRKKTAHFNPTESERIVRFTRLFGIAMETLDTEEAARSWLKAENPGTAGESPLSYADTEFGAREVENLLGRIDYGVF